MNLIGCMEKASTNWCFISSEPIIKWAISIKINQSIMSEKWAESMRKHDIETRMNMERYICCHSRRTDSPLVRALYRLRKSIIIIVLHSSSSSLNRHFHSSSSSVHRHHRPLSFRFLPLFSLLSSALPRSSSSPERASNICKRRLIDLTDMIRRSRQWKDPGCSSQLWMPHLFTLLWSEMNNFWASNAQCTITY